MNTFAEKLGLDTENPIVIGRAEQEQEEADEKTRQERRKERMSFCGTKASRINPLSGKWYSYTMYCGYWRKCSVCRERRMSDFEERFSRAQKDTNANVRLIISRKKESGELTRVLQRSHVDYWRVPTENGIYVFFDGRNFTHEDAIEPLDLDWDLLAYTPLGLRSSGKLGLIQEEEKEDELSIVVKIPDWYIKLPDPIPLEYIYQEVHSVVGDLDDLEFTEESFALRILCLEEAMREVIERHSGEIVERVALKRVTLSAYKDFIEGGKIAEETRRERFELAKPPEYVQSTLVEAHEVPF